MSRQDPYIIFNEDENPADNSYEVIDLINDGMSDVHMLNNRY
jgi:hypothetical protein